jgi:hypothetical protein
VNISEEMVAALTYSVTDEDLEDIEFMTRLIVAIPVLGILLLGVYKLINWVRNGDK